MIRSLVDPKFQQALDERCDAIGELIIPMVGEPVGLAATYWALLGLAAAMRATIVGVEDEERRTQGMKMAAHHGMVCQSELWKSQREVVVL